MQIADGTIRFTLCSADGREVAHEIDSLVATTLADNLVAKHQLATKAGLESETYVFTPEFLADLGAAFAKQFTLPTTSSTVALKLWLAAQREVYGLKKTRASCKDRSCLRHQSLRADSWAANWPGGYSASA